MSVTNVDDIYRVWLVTYSCKLFVSLVSRVNVDQRELAVLQWVAAVNW